MDVKKVLSGLLALAWIASMSPAAAQIADDGMVAFKPGVLKAAIAKGKPALLFYKSTW